MEALQATLDIAITGSFDAATRAAVVAFQERSKLKKDGIAGRETLTRLGLRDAPPAAAKTPAPAAAPEAPQA